VIIFLLMLLNPVSSILTGLYSFMVSDGAWYLALNICYWPCVLPQLDTAATLGSMEATPVQVIIFQAIVSW
jgi:hypothetical protein